MINTHKGFIEELGEFLTHVEEQMENGNITGMRYTHLKGSLFQLETFVKDDETPKETP